MFFDTLDLVIFQRDWLKFVMDVIYFRLIANFFENGNHSITFCVTMEFYRIV